jgi:hypothetical protein
MATACRLFIVYNIGNSYLGLELKQKQNSSNKTVEAYWLKSKILT